MRSGRHDLRLPVQLLAPRGDVLYLSGNNLTDRGVEDLLRFPQNNSDTALDRNAITDTGAWLAEGGRRGLRTGSNTSRSTATT